MKPPSKLAIGELAVRFAWVVGMSLLFVIAAWLIVTTSGP